MSFNHDAAGDRRVARQQFIDELFAQLRQESHEFGHECADALLAEFHIGLVTLLMSGMPKPTLFPNVEHQVVTERVMKEIIKRSRSFAQDEPERCAILLVLAEKLLASAVSRIRRDFAAWEMEKFQEQGYLLKFV